MCLQTIKNPPPRLLNTAHVSAKLDTVRPTLIVPIIARFLRRRSLVIFRNGLCYVQLPLPNVFGRSSQATAQGLTDFACIMATPKLCAYRAFVFVGDQNINFFHWIPFLLGRFTTVKMRKKT